MEQRFLQEFIEHAWDDPRVEKLNRNHKARLVEILYLQHRLDWLEDEELDAASRAFLQSKLDKEYRREKLEVEPTLEIHYFCNGIGRERQIAKILLLERARRIGRYQKCAAERKIKLRNQAEREERERQAKEQKRKQLLSELSKLE